MGKPTETADLSQRELTDSRLTTGGPAEETELGPLNVVAVVWFWQLVGSMVVLDAKQAVLDAKQLR